MQVKVVALAAGGACRAMGTCLVSLAECAVVPAHAGVCNDHQCLPHNVRWAAGAGSSSCAVGDCHVLVLAPARCFVALVHSHAAASQANSSSAACPLCRYANQNGLLDLGLMRSSHNPVSQPAQQRTEPRSASGGCLLLTAHALLLDSLQPVDWLQVSAVLLAVGYGEHSAPSWHAAAWLHNVMQPSLCSTGDRLQSLFIPPFPLAAFVMGMVSRRQG